MALDKNQIAKRIAQEVKDGYYVNLGIGIPTLVANYLREDISVEFQSENGVLGMGPFPFEGEEDPSTESARVENISENASNQFNQSTEEKTEDNSGSMEDKSAQAPPTENNIFALLGLIFSIVPGLGLLGLIFSLVGLSQIKKDGGEGKKLAIAGIIIVGVKFILWCLYFALVVFAASQGY